ncbi:WD40-repeat-containing domain protein [Phaeosphaeria sp. MPI-PUGE-AT-0046c]|nr:WD40-repeat-containing domain protein [Phaeosphaeria sp. MPI-PUGE-AT-0046c]
MSAHAAFLPASNKLGHTHTAPVLALRVSANYVVSGSADRLVRVWFKSNSSLALPPLSSFPEGAIKSVEISEELGLVFGGTSKGHIVIWRLSDGKRVQVEPAHNDTVLCLAIDTMTLVSTSRDRNVKVWELQAADRFESGGLQLRHTLHGHSMAVLAAKLSNDYIYTSSGDRSIRIWDRHSGLLVRSLEGLASITQFQLRKGIDGTEELLGACTDNMVRLFNTDTGAELACLSGHTNVVCSAQFIDLAPSASGYPQIASASYDGTVWIWTPEEQLPYSWHCAYKLSFSDTVVNTCTFQPQTTTTDDPVREERIRKMSELARQQARTVYRALDMQASNGYLYCCGESAHVVVWPLTFNGILVQPASAFSHDPATQLSHPPRPQTSPPASASTKSPTSSSLCSSS